MKLTDQMYDAVADVTADRGALIETARKRGLAMRRRRQALGTVGAAAAVVAIAGGVVALQQGTPTAPADPAASPGGVAAAPTSTAPKPPTTIPLTGRSTAAALKAAVDEVADGTFSDFAGQDPFASKDGTFQSKDTYAELRLTPAGEGLGVVQVNVQDLAILDACSGPKATRTCAAPRTYTCDAWMRECRTKVLPNGDTVRTYTDDVTGIRLVAELLSPSRDIRVVASATDGIDLPSNKWDTTRTGAVLTTQQLVDVVSQPWWGWQVPAEYDGKDLDYTAISNSALED